MNIIRRRSTGTEIQNSGRPKLTHFHYKQRSFDDGLNTSVTLVNSRPLMDLSTESGLQSGQSRSFEDKDLYSHKSKNTDNSEDKGENEGSDTSFGVLRSDSTGTNINDKISNITTSSSFTYSSRPPAIRSNSSSSSLTTKDDKKERRISGSQRHRRGALMVSCENLLADSELFGSHEGSLKAFKSRQFAYRKSGGIFSNPFKSDREKMDQLTDLLNLYGQNGIPEQSGLLTFHTSGDSSGVDTSTDDIYYLEDHWKSIVANCEDLPKKVQNQNDAIWELLQTEVFYLRRLKVITELFLSCLCNLQSECLLNEIDTTKMFSNIVEVSASNHQFWIEHLLPMLNYTRQTHQPLNPMLMKDGFLFFEQIFHPYVKYCLEHSTCLQYVKEKHKDNELFKAYVVWCETHKDCERLRLMDLLVKPMQRLTKYSLLLKAILKKTDSEEQKIALKRMNESVERFVYGVDATLRRQHEHQKLSSIVTRIESYDAIDCNNDEAEKLLKEYVNLDLTQPMYGCSPHFIRHLLVEGSLKLKDSSASSKVDVHCFLFTDLLLICKSVNKKSGDRVRVIRQPFIIDRVITQEVKDGSGFILLYLNEFRVANAILLLYSSDTKTWLDYIKKAQELYRHTKNISIASEPPEVTYFRNLEEDEDYDYPSMALLAASRNSPRSSSRSSLVHSHSGSVDMSDNSYNSLAVIPPPVPTPNLLPHPDSQQQPPRAVSFELGELRNPSLTVEDLDYFGRSHSVDNRSPIAVTVTSPRPERRAFLLRNVKNSGSVVNHHFSHYPNTLTVNVPPNYQQISSEQKQVLKSPPSLPSLQIPILSSPTKTITQPSIRSLPPRPTSPTILSRSLPLNANKPPLLKTKNISGLITHSAPASEGPSPVHSLDSEAQNESIAQNVSKSDESIDKNAEQDLTEDPEVLKNRIHQKRTCRTERRYHTADSIEHMKKEKDSSIHKRLSWNYGQQTHGNKPIPSHCERILCNKHFNKCLSSESVYSSSGFSSTGSVPLSVGSSECEQCGVDILDHIQEMDSYSDSPTVTPNESQNSLQSNTGSDCEPKPNTNVNISNSNIKIDISEVKDGISSVQIRLGSSGVNQTKPSKADLKKMKEFLLTSYNVESS